MLRCPACLFSPKCFTFVMLFVAGSQVQVNLLTYRPKSFAQIIMSLMKNETSHFESSTGHEVVCFWVCRVATTKTCHEIWLYPSTQWYFPTNNSLLSCLSYIMTFFLHLPNKVITQTCPKKQKKALEAFSSGKVVIFPWRSHCDQKCGKWRQIDSQESNLNAGKEMAVR